MSKTTILWLAVFQITLFVSTEAAYGSSDVGITTNTTDSVSKIYAFPRKYIGMTATFTRCDIWKKVLAVKNTDFYTLKGYVRSDKGSAWTTSELEDEGFTLVVSSKMAEAIFDTYATVINKPTHQQDLSTREWRNCTIQCRFKELKMTRKPLFSAEPINYTVVICVIEKMAVYDDLGKLVLGFK